MRLNTGDSAPALSLTALDGSEFSVSTLLGSRYLLSFYRFASCPFCNLRVRELARRMSELPDGFRLVAVFKASQEELTRHVQPEEAAYPILADESGLAYSAYGIENSLGGMFKGMLTRMPTLIKAMARHGLPNMSQGGLTIMPADFLVDESGRISTAYYAADEGDHIPFEQIVGFAEAGCSTA